MNQMIRVHVGNPVAGLDILRDTRGHCPSGPGGGVDHLMPLVGYAEFDGYSYPVVERPDGRLAIYRKGNAQVQGSLWTVSADDVKPLEPQVQMVPYRPDNTAVTVS